MSSNNDKMRSLLMAALMVVSVVAMSAAFAGTAAAGIADADRNISDSEVSPGGEATVTTTVNMDSDGGSLTISEEFSPEVQSASIDSVTVDGEDADTIIAEADSTGAVVTISSVPADATVELTYTVTTADSEDMTYEITGTASSGDDEVNTGSTTLETAADDGDGNDGEDGNDGNDGQEGTNQSESDANLNAGGTYWEGQVLYEDGFESNEDYQIINSETGILERERTANADGAHLIDTSGLSEGEYTLSKSSGSFNFTVVEQDLTITADDGEVRNSGNSEEEFEVDSKRGSFDVEVTADDLDADELQNIFADEDDVSNTEDGVAFSVRGGSTATGNFSGIDADNYTLDFSVTDTDAEDSVDINVSDAGDSEAEFASSVTSDQVGDVADITVELENTDTAAVTVGNIQDDGYQANLTVEDGNDDGEVTIQFNTYEAGNTTGSDLASAANSDDSVTVLEGDNLTATTFSSSRLLTDHGYRMTVRAGEDPTADSDDPGTLNLRPRSTDSLSVGTAPQDMSYDDVEDLADSVSQDSTISEGDQIVVEVDASGIEGLVGGADDYSEFTNDENVSITVEQEEAKANRDPKTAELSDSNTDVYTNGDEDLYYLVVDSSALDISSDDGSYEATFTVEENSKLNPSDDDETVSDTFEMDGREGTIQPPEVEASSGQTISGTTTIAAGSEVRITAEGDDTDNPFLLEETATVQNDGSFSAEFDFGGEPEEGSNFTVYLEDSNGNSLADSVSGVVGEAPTAQVSYSGGISEDGSVVTVDEVYLPEGGFVTIHDASVEDDPIGSVVGTSQYLENGTHTDVQVELDSAIEEDQTLIAMPHMDDNDNQEYDFVDSEGDNDAPYTDSNGDIVVDAGDVTLQTETPTDTTTDEPTDTTTEEPTNTTTEETTPEDGDGDGDSDGDGQPGFGISVAIVALIAAALLAVRRQD